MALATSVTMAGYTWETGKQLINAEVTLGSAEKSSSCRVTLSDPQHIIAAAIINHALSNGGIQPLEGTEKVNQSVSPFIPKAVSSDSGVGGISVIPAFNLADVKPVNNGNGTVDSMASTGGVFTPEVKAFLDTVASRESNGAMTNIAQSYYSKNFEGFFSPAEALKSRSKILGYGNYIGRYQMGILGEGEAKKRFGIKSMTFTPMEQDLMAYQKLIARGALRPLQAGDIKTALLKVSNEWAAIPGGSIHQPQPGATTEFFLGYYAQRLAFYKGTAGSVRPVATTKTAVKPALPTATATPELPIIKGSVISITIAGISYDFVHQGTEMSESGVTVLTGQGLRWLLSRRKRNSTYKDLSLKQLATKVAKEHKVALDYQAAFDPIYEHLDQSGISDYKLLLREVEENGLMISESKTAIVIKERTQLKAASLVLTRGVNLISYQITDKAQGNQQDEISATLPQDTKTFIDPIAGKAVSTKKDVDRNATAGKPTGKAKPSTSGVLKSELSQAVKNRAATKRVAGLPSNFVIPMSLETLAIEPLNTMLTKGFPGVLDRIWVVKNVNHDLANSTTKLDLVSPVEVLDIAPAVTSTPYKAPKPNEPLVIQSGAISDRIYQAALASRGYPTGDSRVPANVACAWAINRIVLPRAGISKIGSNPDLVDSVRAALESGRGVRVPSGQEQKGDLLVMGSGRVAHIGVYMGDGKTLSNSSSKATFSWLGTTEAYRLQYGSATFYRVLS